MGNNLNQSFNVYIGKGKNGKSKLVELMTRVLGEYKSTVPISMITQKRNGIGGTSSEVCQLVGTRYAVMQEPSKGDVINEGIMKQFTSGVEPIIARAPYMVESLEFIPQFKLVVCANQFLKINSNDHGTWRRIRVPKFMSLFTNTPVNDDPEKPYQLKMDTTIEDKFMDKLIYVFMSMLVDIALEKKGLVEDCDFVLSASEAYRESQDVITEFMNEMVIRSPGEYIKKTNLNFHFKKWHDSTYGRSCPQPKEVHSYMDKKYGKATKSGWKDVKIKEDEEPLEDTEELPNIKAPNF
jgi:putative DNA primase/helicase